MLSLRDSDIEFIKKNIGEDSFLLTTDNRREFLIELDDWILDYGFDETGLEYDSLGREAQRIYDYVYSNC